MPLVRFFVQLFNKIYNHCEVAVSSRPGPLGFWQSAGCDRIVKSGCFPGEMFYTFAMLLKQVQPAEKLAVIGICGLSVYLKSPFEGLFHFVAELGQSVQINQDLILGVIPGFQMAFPDFSQS